MKQKGAGLLAVLIIGAILLLIAGSYLNDANLTNLGGTILDIIFWIVVITLIIVAIIVGLIVIAAIYD